MVDKYEIALNYFFNKKDYQKAQQLFLELAEEGNIKAQGMMGSLLLERGNIKEADYWYKKASLQKDLYSMHIYAYFCLDYNKKEKANLLFKKMIEENYIPAINSMAYFYEVGENDYIINKKKALNLYKKACYLNDDKSCIKVFKLEKKLNGNKEAVLFFIKYIGFFKLFKICCSRFFSRFVER